MLASIDTAPNVGIAVPGILAPGKVDGMDVNLLPYFDGSLASSNRGGSSGVAINNLDGGGAEPLKMNMPANSNTSNQYFLLTHLYAFFGSLLGCTTYSMPGFPAYDGFPSQYQVHKFMDLNHYEVSYFIQQVGLAASSFGVAKDDITTVAGALDKLFNYRCSPPATAIKAQGPQLQSICIEETVSDFPCAEIFFSVEICRALSFVLFYEWNNLFNQHRLKQRWPPSNLILVLVFPWVA